MRRPTKVQRPVMDSTPSARAGRSLHRKFISVLTATASALALVAALVTYQFALRQAMENGRQSLHALIDAVEGTVEVAVYAGDKILLQELSEGVARHALVRHVRIRDASGRIMMANGTDKRTGAEMPSGADTVEQELYSPFDKSERIGSLSIEVNTDELKRTAQRQAVVLGLSMILVAVVLVLILNALALRKLSRPLRLVAQDLSRMEPGTSQRIQLSAAHQDDELGVFATAANRLLQANEEALIRERSAREQIAAMEARYRQIFSYTSAGIFALSPEGRLLNSNPTVGRLLGRAPRELESIADDDFVEHAFVNPRRARELIARAGSQGGTVAGDLGVRCTDGSLKWVHCLFSAHSDPHRGDSALFIDGVMYDITQRKREEHAVRQRASIDVLTGLKNRAGTQAALNEALAAANAADGSPVTMFYIDLDGFKVVNDSLGHAAGDIVLVECGRRLRGLARQGLDIVGRLGGDEMVVVVINMDPSNQAATEMAKRIVQALSAPIHIDANNQVQVSASVGIAGYPSHARSAVELFKRADNAMYMAKRAGKNRFVMAEAQPLLTRIGVSQ